jgi:hypothetical protein
MSSPQKQRKLVEKLMRSSVFGLVCLFGWAIASSNAFLIQSPQKLWQLESRQGRQVDEITILSAVARQPSTAAETEKRREMLLARDGPYFKLERLKGDVEFGSTAKLLTKLDDEPNSKGIATWLSEENGRGLAMSIWDEKLMTPLGNSVFRLQTMKLQFITIQLAPSVDVKMWTQLENGNPNTPIFSLQSVGFDPNIQILPGVGISASSLGIEIEVAGELRPTKDGRGVTGIISFQTSGSLPPPMRILPMGIFQIAFDTINETIVKFAIESFQKGAKSKYREFQSTQNQQ